MKKLFFSLALVLTSAAMFAQNNNLQDYTGIFKFSDAPFQKIIVTLEEGVLVADAEGVGKGEISATDVKDEFSESNNQALLKFIRDANGSIIKLEVSAQGMSFSGLKQALDLNIYVGEYALKENSSVDKFVVSLRDGVLSVDTNVGNSDLAATSEKDIFLLKAVDGKVGFTRDSSGKVAGVNVVAMGLSLEGTKK